MGDESDNSEKSKELANRDAASKASSAIRDEGKKSENLKALSAKDKSSRTSSNDIAALVSAVENRIREFFEVVTKRVSDLLNDELQQLKKVSKEEFAKVNSALLEYKIQLEKILQEKMTRVAEIKSKSETRIITAEEVQSVVKYFDEKRTEVMKITQNIINTMRKSKVADTFTTDFQTVVADCSKRVTMAMDALFKALKDTAGDLSKAVPDKKTLMTKIPKMPITSALQRTSVIWRNVYKIMSGSLSGANDSGKTREGPLIPANLRKKLPTFNLSKHFNSKTTYGRANAAKATYVGVLLYFLYWKFKKSKS